MDDFVGFMVLMVSLIGLGTCLVYAIKWNAHNKEKAELRDMLRRNPQHAAEIQKAIAVTESQWREQFQPKSRPSRDTPKKKGGGGGKYVVMALCAIYVICPIDAIPDVIPVLGWGDDVVAGLIGLRALFK